MNLIEPIIEAESFTGEDLASTSQKDVDDLLAFFIKGKVKDKLTVNLEDAIMDFHRISRYEGMVVSKFYIDDDLHVGLADGYVLNVSDIIRQIQEVLDTKK